MAKTPVAVAPKKVPPETKRATTAPTKAAVQTAKKPKGKTPVKPSAAKPTKLTPQTERELAQSVGLGLIQFRILRAMSDGADYSYRDIEAKTGYYKNLTPAMRPQYEGSLCAKGLTKETLMEVDGKEKIFFTITAQGKKLVKDK